MKSWTPAAAANRNRAVRTYSSSEATSGHCASEKPVLAVRFVIAAEPETEDDRGEPRDTWPKLAMRAPPKYPKDASRYGVEGEVLLLAIVEEDGSVGRLSVISTTATRHESLYRPQFEQAALDAVRQWRYEPARRDGKPEAFPITISIAFTRQ